MIILTHVAEISTKLVNPRQTTKFSAPMAPFSPSMRRKEVENAANFAAVRGRFRRKHAVGIRISFVVFVKFFWMLSKKCVPLRQS
ncbi:MAG: hypothetical protein ACI4AM_00805 [Muribaculaceae bacterium]